MGTHLIPRSNVKGQDRIFIWFSIPGLIGTVIGIMIGFPIYSIINMNGDKLLPGLAVLAFLGLIGFVIGQVKVPDTAAFPLFKKVGGEYIRNVIKNYFIFNQRGRKKFVIEMEKDQLFDVSEDKVEKVLMNEEKMK